MTIPTIKLSGSLYDMGYQHGKTYADSIRMFTEERMHLCTDVNWTGFDLSHQEIMELGKACLEEHYAYAPTLMTELEGMAAATELGMVELMIMNGFTDFVDLIYKAGSEKQEPQKTMISDNCTAFLVPDNATADGHGFYGQTWDMHATATPYVILLEGQPDDNPNFLVFSITGCVGMIGMNDQGIAIGINNLSASDGQVGVTWPFVIRKALMQDNLDDAVACVVDAKRTGAHNYMLFDKHGKGYNIEAMSTECQITELDDGCIAHTNHCLIESNIDLERYRPPELQQLSINRLNRADNFLSERPITEEMLMEITRDEGGICVQTKPPLDIETCGAAIMRPATGDFWAVRGLPSEYEYTHFKI